MSDLETRLRELGADLELPPAPDVTPTVLRRIESSTPRRRAGFALPRYVVAVVLVIVVGFAGVLVGSPEVRAAIADLLRFAGIVVRETPGTPEALPTTTPTTSPERIEERVSGIAEASRRVGIPVRPPAVLGKPDEVYVIDNRVAGLVYRDEGIRVDQFDGSLDFAFVKSVQTEPEWVRVDGTEGLWFDQPHELVYVDRDGRQHREAARLAGNTLIWQLDDNVTYRLEGELDRQRALEIAGSVER